MMKRRVFLILLALMLALTIPAGVFAQEETSDIPVIYLTSSDPENEGREFVDASKSNVTTGAMVMTAPGDTVVYDGELTQIKARGNSTFTHTEKKSYQIKLDKKTDLLGTGEKVKTWVLLAGSFDATKIHDKTMKDLAASLGMDYVASCEWVDLYYDGEYRGLYLLSEKNSVNKAGVNITDMEEAYGELNPDYGEDPSPDTGRNRYDQLFQYTPDLAEPEDLTGGYLLELNYNRFDEASGFYTRKHRGVNVKSPEWAGEEAMRYISEFYQEFEDAVYARDAFGNYTGYNSKTGKYYYEYADKDSLVRMFLLQELSGNPDEFSRSTFFYKNQGDTLLVCGPIWDQDLVFGTGLGKNVSPDTVYRTYLVEALVKIPDFQTAVREYYQSTFADQAKTLLGENGILARNTERIRASAEADRIIWPAQTTYQQAVDDMMDWVEKRIAYMDQVYGPGTDGALEPPADPSSSSGAGNGGGAGHGGGGMIKPDPVPLDDPEPSDDEPASPIEGGGVTEGDGEGCLSFTDVPDDVYFCDPVKWAVGKEITNGIDEIHFGPDQSCTRAQMVTFLWRAVGSPTNPASPAGGGVTEGDEGGTLAFTDVPKDAYSYQAVLWAVEQGITTGTSETTFSPDDIVTRGQSVTFLYRMKGNLASPAGGGATEGDGGGLPAFTDVPQDAYYYDAVLWAADAGVTTGKTETLFGPDDDCTRAQIVTFLYRTITK